MITLEYETEFTTHSFSELWEKYGEHGIDYITCRMPIRHRPIIEKWLVKTGYTFPWKLLLSNNYGEYCINHYLIHDPFPVEIPTGYRIIKKEQR